MLTFNIKIMNRLRKFIEENDLDFNEGSRNTTVVCLIGFSQHLGLTRNDLENELIVEMNEDSFIGEEIGRLWEYCKNRNYKDYWSKPIAKATYKF